MLWHYFTKNASSQNNRFLSDWTNRLDYHCWLYCLTFLEATNSKSTITNCYEKWNGGGHTLCDMNPTGEKTHLGSNLKGRPLPGWPTLGTKSQLHFLVGATWLEPLTHILSPSSVTTQPRRTNYLNSLSFPFSQQTRNNSTGLLWNSQYCDIVCLAQRLLVRRAQ